MCRRRPGRAGGDCRPGSKTSSSRISPCSSSTTADVDAVLPQSLGLGLHVVDVDVRDAASAAARPRERDLHPAALELRPAVVGVDERLGEAELVAVEAPRRVEVADAVPDRHSARPGSSRNSFSVLEELGAVRAVDRAVVAGSVTVIVGRATSWPSAHDARSSVDADGEDRGLRRVQHGDELLDAEHAEVRDRERPPSRSSRA